MHGVHCKWYVVQRKTVFDRYALHGAKHLCVDEKAPIGGASPVQPHKPVCAVDHVSPNCKVCPLGAAHKKKGARARTRARARGGGRGGALVAMSWLDRSF